MSKSPLSRFRSAPVLGSLMLTPGPDFSDLPLECDEGFLTAVPGGPRPISELDQHREDAVTAAVRHMPLVRGAPADQEDQ